jgi:transcriptional regulator with XRE-family HTH domain
MSTQPLPLATYLQDLIQRRGITASKLAAEISISHATVSRWLSGRDIPSPRSCQKLAAYAGAPSERILALAGHLAAPSLKASLEWPEFREYAQGKYGDELDEDLIIMIEDLIARRKKHRLSTRPDSYHP